MSTELRQAIVISDDAETAVDGKGSYIDVLELPSFAKIKKVQLPRTVHNQVIPKKNDLILIWRPNHSTAIYITTLKDDEEFLKGSLRREVKDGEKYFKPGEILHESAGQAYHYISNAGDHHLVAGGNQIAKVRVQQENDNITIEGRDLDFRTTSQCRMRLQSLLDDDGDPFDEISLQIGRYSASPLDLKIPDPYLKAQVHLSGEGDILLETRDGKRQLVPPTGEQNKQKTRIKLKQDNSIEIITNDNEGDEKARITLDIDGNVVIEAGSIKLGADASESAVLGDAFLTLFNNHIHSTAVGPTGPPSEGPPGPSEGPMTKSTHLAEKVKVE